MHTIPGHITYLNAVPQAITNGSADGFIAQLRTTPFTGIEDRPVVQNGLRIFPNPAQNELNVWSDLPSGQVRSVEVFNSLGQSVFQMTDVRDQRLTIPSSHLASGTYSVVVRTDRSAQVAKFIVQR